MKALLCSMLYFLSMTNGEHSSDTRMFNLTDPTLSFEQIADIVNNPIYRENAPSRLAYTNTPESYEALPTDEVIGKSEIFSKMPRMPSRELEPPLESAEDVYDKYAAAPSPAPLPMTVNMANKEQDNSEYTPQDNQQYAPMDDPFISDMAYLENAPTPSEPSKHLELPFYDLLKTNPQYPPMPSRDLETPLFEPYYAQYSGEEVTKPIITQQLLPYKENKNAFVPVISQKLQPPRYMAINNQHNPTKIHPKKYNSRLNEIKKKKLLKTKPVIELINEDSNEGVRYYKSQKPQKLIQDPAIARGNHNEGREPYLHKQALEKQRQMYEETQLKKREKLLNEAREQQEFLDESVSKTFGANQDPETSETAQNTFEDGGETSFAAPINHPSTGGGIADASHGGDGERTEFRMHGQQGPHSYKFGYDTGEGKNRQFRFEERDNDGYVRGHYGYYDRHGKLQVVNYDAHPHRGFHAEGPFGKV